MERRSSSKTFTFLIVLSCLIPVAALGAVLFLNVPVWPASLSALVVLILLARRIFALLSIPGQDESSTLSDLSRQSGLGSFDRHPR